jgi:hypothetical protein
MCSLFLILSGDFYASGQHLQELIDTLSKDQHLLTNTDIDGSDAMNYDSVQKISSPVVVQCLTKIAASEGTRLYLDILRNAIDSFNEKLISLEERIDKIWFAVFCLRGWRRWLTEQEGFTMQHFITLNAYVCIELNAHNLLNLIVKLRSSGKGNLCNILHCQSQTCEQFFRVLRSMTSTLCTIVNFSILDVLNRIRRIDIEMDLTSKLGDTLTMYGRKNIQESHSIVLPSNDEILKTVECAYERAKEALRNVGIRSDCRVTQLSGEYSDTLIDDPDDRNILCDAVVPEVSENIVDDLSLIVNNSGSSLHLPRIDDIQGKNLYLLEHILKKWALLKSLCRPSVRLSAFFRPI